MRHVGCAPWARRFRGTELDADAEYDFDGGIEMYESRNKRGNVEAQKARERSRQVGAAGGAGRAAARLEPLQEQHTRWVGRSATRHHLHASSMAQSRLRGAMETGRP